MTTALIDADGHLHIPAEAPKALRVHGKSEIELIIDEENETVLLRPAQDDSWLYSEENLASARRAAEDVREGGVRTATEAELRALAEAGEWGSIGLSSSLTSSLSRSPIGG